MSLGGWGALYCLLHLQKWKDPQELSGSQLKAAIYAFGVSPDICNPYCLQTNKMTTNKPSVRYSLKSIPFKVSL